MNAPVELKLELNLQPEFQLPIQNYHEFYRFYLTEHRNIISRRLHVFGSSVGIYSLAKRFVKESQNILSMGCYPAMLVHGSDISFLRKINRLVLNNQSIVLFRIGVCFPMYYEEI